MGLKEAKKERRLNLMLIDLNPVVLKNGRHISETMVYNYQLDGKLLPAGAPMVLDLFLAKAEECLNQCTGSSGDDIISGARVSGPAPIEVRLDYANELVAWTSVAVELLAHESSGEQPFIDILRRGYVPPLRFTAAESQLYNSYHRLVKLCAAFVDSMPLQSLSPVDDLNPFGVDQIYTSEYCLSLASQVSGMVLTVMHCIRPDRALPGKALWQSKQVAAESKLQRMLSEEDANVADSRGKFRLVETSVVLPDGTVKTDWDFRPF